MVSLGSNRPEVSTASSSSAEASVVLPQLMAVFSPLELRRYFGVAGRNATASSLKKGRWLYHKDSSIIRLRSTSPNHIWAIDVVHDKLSNGRPDKMLTVLDEYSREALCVTVRSKMNDNDLLVVPHRLLMKNSKPGFIRSVNGPELIAASLQEWLRRFGIQPMQIFPGSLRENSYNERFNGTLRREVLNAEWFHTTKKTQVTFNS